MKVDPLPPIPTPPERHWRHFRQRGFPAVTFLIVLGVTAWLWGRNLANPMVMGQAEGPEANVATPVSGRIARLTVNSYQEVKAGDVIAMVDASDPLVLSNTLSVIRAEMDAIRAEAGFRPGDRVRLAQFQMDWLNLRAELAPLRAQVQYSESKLERILQLAKNNATSQYELDIAKRDVEQLQAELRDKTAAAETAEKALKQFDLSGNGEQSASLRAALAEANERLRLAEAQLQPLTLRAPISGRIIKLDYQAQASVVRGDVIAVVASPNVDRIVGYIGQPVRLEPKVGMRTEVRSRGTVRQTGEATIAHVGPRIELFNAPLRVRGMGSAQERGLPIVLTVPPNMTLRPGELVDIRLLVE